MGENLKLCTQCVHRINVYGVSKCKKSVLVKAQKSIVDGTQAEALFQSCVHVRHGSQQCSTEGKWFEQKASLLSLWRWFLEKVRE